MVVLPGHYTMKGSLLTAGVSFANQRAVVAKAPWGVEHVSTLSLCCTSPLTFISRDFWAASCCFCLGLAHRPAAPKRVAVLELVWHQPPRQVLVCVFEMWLPGCRGMLCRAA